MEKVSPIPDCTIAGDLTNSYPGDPFPPARLSRGTDHGDSRKINCGIDTATSISLSWHILAETRYPDSRREKKDGTFNPYIDPSIKKDKNLVATLHQTHLEKWEEEYVWCQLENYRIIKHMIILKIAFGIFFLSIIILIGVLFIISAS